MGPVLVVEGLVLAERVHQVGLVHDQGAVEEFGSVRPHPALHDRVHARYTDTGLHDGEIFAFEDRVERGRVPAVAVPDQVPHRGASVLEVHDQVAGQLRGPGCGGVGGGTENTDAAGGVLDDSEDVQPCAGQGPGFEEVGGDDRVCLAAQEGGPGLVVALGCGLDPVALEDFPNRGGGDLDAEGGQFAVDASVAPARVLAGQAEGEGLDATAGGWPAWPFRAGCLGVVTS